MLTKITTICLVLVAAVFANASEKYSAEEKAFQASLTPHLAIYDRTEKIAGLTLSIWGENPQQSAAFGFVNGCTGKSMGACFGLVNYAESYKGAQFSFFNTDDLLNGIQFGILNYTKKSRNAFQFGIINIIDDNKEWFDDFPHSLAPVMIFVNWRLED